MKMITCSKCGEKNEDDAKFCVRCGVSLYSMENAKKRGDTCFGWSGRGMENECFGLPHGGAIVSIIFGAIIILFGLTNFLGWRVDIGAFIVIVIGLLVVAGALYGLSRRS